MVALNALNEMRRQGLSLTKAARQNHISPKTLRKIIEPALKRKGRGFVPTASDKLLRVMILPTAEGRIEVGVRSARTAKRIAEYDAAVKRFIHTGDASALEGFQGISITANGRKIPLLTDLDELERLGEVGELSFESIYAATA
jgi:hypothetical protein